MAYVVQQQFGKTPSELEAHVEAISAFTSQYPIEDVLFAIFTHCRRSKTIPTTSEIVNIIEPPRPKPNWPVYIALKKKISDGYFPLSDERKFLRQCEDYAKENHAQELENYNEAQKKISSYVNLID